MNATSRNSRNPGNWIEATVQLTGNADDCLETFLSECLEEGAVGGVVEALSKDLETAGGERCEACGKTENLLVYFPLSLGIDQVVELIDREARGMRATFPETSARLLRCRVIQKQDWASKWRQGFPPERVTKHLWVIPPWERPALSPQDIPMILEPGLAFGTGKHPTTRHCLLFLEEILHRQAGGAQSLLDVGCGSAILAIAGRKLGAKMVVGLEVDPDAMQTARNNLELNQLVGGLLLVVGTTACCRGHFDLIAANLTAPILMEHGREFRRLLKPGGSCVLAGMLNTEKPGVIHAYQELGFRLAAEREDPQEGWTTLLLQG